ncbi:MAG: hypothetical protein P1U86_00220 [Verrucomicrobiales bacterium]|nr:hypothetical protein [Verrucomicrobiales bacterium]
MKKELLGWALFYAGCVVLVFGIGIALFSPELEAIEEEGFGATLDFAIPSLMILLIFLLTWRKVSSGKFE